jgi:hypothetical protein
MARDPDPALRIPLAPMGYQAPTSEFLLAGSSMLTVHFVDNDHLLITFGLRRLMKREVDPPPDDDDRTIGALLVELPSGKVVARTEWRVHDRLQYLWGLGPGRFLLRVRDRLTVLAPMASPDDPFHDIPLLQTDRHIVVVLVSSDGDLMTVETIKRPEGAGRENVSVGTGAPADTAPVQSNFYRLLSKGAGADQLVAVSAGAIRTARAIALPMTTAGFLEVLEGAKDTWMFNFNEHAGKVNELPAFDTSCFPRVTFVGHSEFVAFGCRGSDGKQDFAGFNLKGDEMWQQNFFEPYVTPTFAFAPAAGRFALSRVLVTASFDSDSTLPNSAVTGQEVRVYQTYSGRQLLHIDCSPVERAGQNFALSEDGLRLAVIRETLVHHAAKNDLEAYTEHSTAVEVYALPQLTDKDRAAVKDAQALAPPDPGARIDASLARLAARADAAATAEATNHPAGTPPEPPSPVQTTDGMAPDFGTPDAANVAGAESGGDPGSAVGDPEPTGPRTPPTLYGPNEKKPK